MCVCVYSPNGVGMFVWACRMYFYRRGAISPVEFNETDPKHTQRRKKKELSIRERCVWGAEVRTMARKVRLIVLNIGKKATKTIFCFVKR